LANILDGKRSRSSKAFNNPADHNSAERTTLFISYELQPAKKKLPLYLDDMLDVDQMQAIAEHLRTCKACRKEEKAFQRSWELLGELKSIDPVLGYIPRFWRKLTK